MIEQDYRKLYKNKFMCVEGGIIIKRKHEIIGSLGGMLAGMCIGTLKSGLIVYVTGPAGVVPSAIIWGTIGLLGGNKVGSKIHRYKR